MKLPKEIEEIKLIYTILSEKIAEPLPEQDTAIQKQTPYEYIEVSLRPRSKILQTAANVLCGVGIGISLLAALVFGGDYVSRKYLNSQNPKSSSGSYLTESQDTTPTLEYKTLEYKKGYKALNAKAKTKMDQLVTTISMQGSSFTNKDTDKLCETIDALGNNNKILEPEEIDFAKSVIDTVLVYRNQQCVQ